MPDAGAAGRLRESYLFRLRGAQRGRVWDFRVRLRRGTEASAEYEKYLPYVTDQLVQQAEEKIRKQTAQHEEKAHFYLTVDEEGYLCLAAEQIIKLANDQAGCGLDHDHLFFKERISREPL